MHSNKKAKKLDSNTFEKISNQLESERINFAFELEKLKRFE